MVQTIIPSLKAMVPIEIIAEFIEENNNLTIVIKYDGELYDPLTHGDDVSVLLAVSKSSDSKYEYIKTENGGTNELTVVFDTM